MSDEQKQETICDAIREAERFLDKAESALAKLQSDSMVYIVGSKETAAMKRASMDLTRALVEIRR